MAFAIDYADDWRRGYIDLCKRVVKQGQYRDGTRGGGTMEIRDFIFTLAPDATDLPVGTGRGIHEKLAAAEAIQLCAGVGVPTLTEAVSSQIASFVRDPDGTVHGNYGARIGLQIIDVVNKLQADPFSRQAVIQLWDKTLDSRWRLPMPKDIPCTLSMAFGVDDLGRLIMSVVMRSNDVWLGVPYDVFQFRQLQRTIANLLNRYTGQYTHHAISMHAYERNTAQILSLAFDSAHEAVQDRMLPTGLRIDHPSSLPHLFHNVLMGVDLEHPSHQWYYMQLGEAYAATVG